MYNWNCYIPEAICLDRPHVYGSWVGPLYLGQISCCMEHVAAHSKPFMAVILMKRDPGERQETNVYIALWLCWSHGILSWQCGEIFEKRCWKAPFLQYMCIQSVSKTSRIKNKNCWHQLNLLVWVWSKTGIATGVMTIICHARHKAGSLVLHEISRAMKAKQGNKRTHMQLDSDELIRVPRVVDANWSETIVDKSKVK